jgi:hypothetical protein
MIKVVILYWRPISVNFPESIQKLRQNLLKLDLTNEPCVQILTSSNVDAELCEVLDDGCCIDIPVQVSVYCPRKGTVAYKEVAQKIINFLADYKQSTRAEVKFPNNRDSVSWREQDGKCVSNGY